MLIAFGLPNNCAADWTSSGRAAGYLVVPTVLLIDDEDELREVMAANLERAGFTVVQRTNGRRAAEICAATPVDVVVLDMVMPEVEGMETVIALKAAHPNLPVIAITGSSHASKYFSIATKLGARAILKKPFSVDELMAAIDSVFGDVTAGRHAAKMIRILLLDRMAS